MEKEMKLRQGLNVVGVSHTTYWIHWIIIGTLLNFLQCCVQMLFGFIYGFKLFTNCDFNILFYVFFTFGQSMVFMAFVVSTMVTKQDKANQLSYSLVLAILLIQMVFQNADFTLKLFYSKRIQGFFYVYIVTTILEMVPTYNFSMAFGMISSRASKRFDFNHATWIDGGPFTTADYNADVHYDIKTTGDIVDAYAAHYWMNNIV